jgi:hypothetical protein
VEQGSLHQNLQRVPDYFGWKGYSLEVFLVQKIRTIRIAVQIAHGD